MPWRSMVWREAGNYGPAGAWEPRRQLGDLTFPRRPEVGMILELDGEDYQVVTADTGYCHVRPMRMRPL